MYKCVNVQVMFPPHVPCLKGGLCFFKTLLCSVEGSPHCTFPHLLLLLFCLLCEHGLYILIVFELSWLFVVVNIPDWKLCACWAFSWMFATTDHHHPHPPYFEMFPFRRRIQSKYSMNLFLKAYGVKQVQVVERTVCAKAKQVRKQCLNSCVPNAIKYFYHIFFPVVSLVSVQLQSM